MSSLSRRTVLKGVGAAATGTLGLPLLAGCGDGTRTDDLDVRNRDVLLPKHIPPVVEGVTPDLKGDGDLPNGFLAYPEPVKSTDGPPLPGGVPVSAFYMATEGTPKGKSSNRWWQQLDERLGAELSLTMPPYADYGTKISTTIAGGDIPDLVQLFPDTANSSNPGNLDKVLRNLFTDLSPYLAGDAIEEYPNLAASPPATWRGTVFDGGIYGVPYPLGLIGTVLMYRQDVLGPRGLDGQPSSAEELTELCRALTDPKKRRYAATYGPGSIQNFILDMFGVPNTWADEDGSFTRHWETPQYKDAIDYMAKLWKQQLIHPDSYGSAADGKRWLGAKAIGLFMDNYSADRALLGAYGESGMVLRRARPPLADGGGWAAHRLSSGINSFCAFRKADEGRVRELLTMLNWLAAPFGTEERLFVDCGIEGVDFNWVDGDPVLTDTGTAEFTVSVYMARDAPTVYTPGFGDNTKDSWEHMKAVLPDGISDPTIGLTSPTALKEDAQLTRKFESVVSDVVQGRSPLSAIDEACDDWRSSGGDEIRAEYQEAAQRRGDS